MSKTTSLKLLKLLAWAPLLAAGQADADDSSGLVPATVCQPINKESGGDFLRNSTGTLANMSADQEAWVQCPIRMPALVSPSQTLEWTAHFLGPTPKYCRVRLQDAYGDIIASVSSEPTRQAQISVPFSDLGTAEVSASVRCLLPPSSATYGRDGITTMKTIVH